ncbi:MAG: hypothetical protein ABJF10_26170 [Chthoniobacter sp.]|uniref:hypothetical protein n=1 Tax=Chthoniobacter sp. TaxID=2510640 RepID=UPI0032AE3315
MNQTPDHALQWTAPRVAKHAAVSRHRRRIMISRVALLLLLTAFFAGTGICADSFPSALRLESLGYPRHDWHQSPDCTITDVQFSDQEIYVQFIGRWSPSTGSSDSDKQAISISRDPSVSPVAFACLARRFSDRQGETVTITIAATAWITRGGIPILRYTPADSFEITSRNPTTPDHPSPQMALAVTAPAPATTFSPALQPPDCLRQSLSLRTTPR